MQMKTTSLLEIVCEEVTSFLTKGVGFGGKKTLRSFRCWDTADEQKADLGFQGTVDPPYHDGIRNCPNLTKSFIDEAGSGVLMKLQESDGINLCPAPDVFIPNEDLHWPISSLTEVPSMVSDPVNHSPPGLSTAAPPPPGKSHLACWRGSVGRCLVDLDQR